jgi:hypothetical protein
MSLANVGAEPKKLFASMYVFVLLCEEINPDIYSSSSSTFSIFFS